MRRRRIAIVEDHLLQRTFTEQLIAAQPDMQVVCSTTNLPDYLSWAESRPPHVLPHLIVLDLMVDRGPNADPAVVQKLVAAGQRVVVFSAVASPPLARRMLRAGVSGLIGKQENAAAILTALRSTLDGRQWMSPELAQVIIGDPQRPKLSDQEERALVLYISGVRIDAIAAAIGVKRDTAKKYLQRVRAKYAGAGRPIRSPTELSRRAADDGYFALLPNDEPEFLNVAAV